VVEKRRYRALQFAVPVLEISVAGTVFTADRVQVLLDEEIQWRRSEDTTLGAPLVESMQEPFGVGEAPLDALCDVMMPFWLCHAGTISQHVSREEAQPFGAILGLWHQ